MKNSLTTIYVLLLIATVATACVSGSFAVSKAVGVLIMALATIKFLLVAFHFMELKKAHAFWKVSLIGTLGLIVLLVVIFKSSF